MTKRSKRGKTVSCKKGLAGKRKRIQILKETEVQSKKSEKIKIGTEIYAIEVVSGKGRAAIAAKGIITETDREMDVRAKQAVRVAIKEAKRKNVPVARYDKKTKSAYLEYADGKRVYE